MENMKDNNFNLLVLEQTLYGENKPNHWTLLPLGYQQQGAKNPHEPFSTDIVLVRDREKYLGRLVAKIRTGILYLNE